MSQNPTSSPEFPSDSPPSSGHGRPVETAQEDRIPVGEKLAYGCSEPVYSFGSWVPKLMANQVFNMTLGVSPVLISVAMVIFRLWDAITDPLMGWISDNFRSRYGRRRPFMFVSAFLVALVFPLMWLVNPDWSTAKIMAWFIGIGLVYYTVQTIGNIPYQSLLLEMSPDYNERTRIAGYRAFMASAFGFVSAWVWYLTQLPMFADPETGAPDTLRGMQGVSVLLALIFLVLALMTPLFCKERYYHNAEKSAKEPLLKSIRITLKNRPFLLLAGLVVTMQIGSGMIGNFGAYVLTYYVYHGSQSSASVVQGWGQTAAAVVSMSLIPVIAKLSSSIGKERAMMWLISGKLVLSAAIWFCYNPVYPWLAMIPLILLGPLQGCLWMIIPSMLADIVDHDELGTGERREGSFSSIFAWLLKLAITVGIGIAGPLLAMTGFDATLPTDQPVEVLLRMRLIMVSIPVVTCALLLWLLVKYPLSPGRMQDIRAQLEARRGKISAGGTAG
ncbi:MAG: MFS transporter [Verrucomicrobiota bacterium JB024]|nr:MFS transporter [Verrucomicrobiota bacterium JB024]